VSYDFCDRIAAGRTVADVGQAFAAEIARHGFTHSACRAFVPTAEGVNFRILFRDWPKDRVALSDRNGFTANNFIIAEARRRMTGFTWGEAASARKLTAAERRNYEHARALGLHNGFVTPVHGPGGYFALVSISSPERDLDFSFDARLHLQTLAVFAHERASALAGAPHATTALETMSERELECLRWVATGKTDWEIGVILSISSSTVRFHVDNARTKLGARTRAQAVARLVLSGLY
jgi:DNA-binding CsgD family transcriptional regulator